MKQRFAGLSAKDYEFKNLDGSVNRKVIALRMGGKPVGFIEYDTARQFVDLVHDLCDAHEKQQREGNAQ